MFYVWMNGLHELLRRGCTGTGQTVRHYQPEKNVVKGSSIATAFNEMLGH